MVECIILAHRRVRPLVLLVKALPAGTLWETATWTRWLTSQVWAKGKKVCGAQGGNLSSYSWTIMARRLGAGCPGRAAALLESCRSSTSSSWLACSHLCSCSPKKKGGRRSVLSRLNMVRQWQDAADKGLLVARTAIRSWLSHGRGTAERTLLHL